MKKIILLIMFLLTSMLFANTYIVSQAGFGDFLTIRDGVEYLIDNEIDGKLIILPGIYNENVNWNTDISHITISGVYQETCIVEGWFTVNGMNNNENDLIENLTFRNTGCAIANWTNGLNTIKNNKFVNCTDLIVINYSSIKLIDNIFINNNCQMAVYSPLYSQSSSTAYSVIENNVFENNTTIGPLIEVNGMGTLHIKNNTFLDNSLVYEMGSFGDGSVLEIHSSYGYITSCDIKGNVFQNNIDENYLSEAVLFVDNEDSWAAFSITENDFIENNAVAMINYYSDQPTGHIHNSIFESNILGNNNVVIDAINLITCDYSLFYNNKDYNNIPSSNGNFTFGSNILTEVDPFLDTNNQPLWNSTTKSPCIDIGYGTDPDGTPADIGAIPAITHKYDIVELPSVLEDNGWKWLSFPALDNVYSTPSCDPDQAYYLLYDILHPVQTPELYRVYNEDGDYVWQTLGTTWNGTDEIFSRTEGYKFKMNEAATLEVPGFKVPDNTAVELEGNAGENWIGYWLEDTQSVEDAFRDYWDEGDIYSIKHQRWSAYRRNGEWSYKVQQGYSPTLSYGDMVIVLCNNAISYFSWNSGSPTEMTVFAETEHFSFEEQIDYIPLFIELDSNNMPQEIGAMVNGECIGATVVEDTLTQINAYTTSVPPGNIELELYYGNRSENKQISSYNCATSSNSNITLKQLSTENSDDAWFINLREDSSIVSKPEKMNLDNYPNPFNPTTTIAYSISNDGLMELSVFNIKGQLVKTLVKGEQLAGNYEVVWNGKDNNQKSVSSGIYFYKLSTKNDTIMKKMLMLK